MPSSPEPSKLWGWILVYSIGDARSTDFVQMQFPGLPLTFLGRCQISVLVAVAILEEGCIASADMQWLFYSGEWIVVIGPLVYYIDFNVINGRWEEGKVTTLLRIQASFQLVYHKYSFPYKYYFWGNKSYKINEGTQEMQRLRSTTCIKHRKKKPWCTNNDKTQRHSCSIRHTVELQ